MAPTRKKNVPDRWDQYSNIGLPIAGTRFICFKVPLKEGLTTIESRGMEFPPTELLEYCANLGMVIDLTNTNRYYNPEDLLHNGIEHVKIKTQGHIIPEKSVVHRFFRTVETFLEHNKHNQKLIGVHCTHGINRTGYLVCRYMIQRLGVPPDQAIADFNSARGHEMERQNYIDDLRRAKWRNEEIYLNSPAAVGAGPSFHQNSGFRHGMQRGGDLRNMLVRGPPQGNGFTPSRGYNGPRSPHLGGATPRGTAPDVRNRLASPSFFARGRNSYEDQSPYSNQASFYDDPQDPQDSMPPLLGSPRVAKSYYESYYRGPIQPQFDQDYYQSYSTGLGAAPPDGGYRDPGIIGPHRPVPRNLNPSEPNRPRQYRGPRPYQSPLSEEPLPPYNSSHPDLSAAYASPRMAPVSGPPRNIFSPGLQSDIFSPENQMRMKSRRFQPY